MCGMCPDVIAWCSKKECGARDPVDPVTGRKRWQWMRHFTLNEIPCRHVLDAHRRGCALALGRDCDCDEDDGDA